ncbi:MAG: diacylglycerol/lipid kinase family protein [Bacteroidota bacterium]
MTRRTLIFHNTFAAKGKNRFALAKITTLLQQEGIAHQVLETIADVKANHYQLLKVYEEFTPTEIWVSGGDGTLHLFVNSLPENMWHLPVAVIPSGTGNDFVKNYTGKPAFENCLAIALNGSPQPVDVWQCNNRLFIHGFGVGFDGRIVESMMHSPSWFSGFLAYYYHVIKHLFTYREQVFTLTANGKTISFLCFMVTIANSTTFGGGFKITPEAIITDHLLDVCAIHKVSIIKRGRCLKMVENGKHLHLPILNYFNTDKIKLQLPSTMPAHIDGELFYDDNFEIAPFAQKLHIKMPTP